MQAKRDWWSREFRIMVAVGDSITAGGWASCRERRWTNLLAGMIGELQRGPVQMVNVGIGGNVISTKSAAYAASQKPSLDERLERHVLSNTANGNPIVPDLLLIAFGVNDMRGGTPIPVYCQEMEKIIGRVREKFQPLIVLLGLYHIRDYQLGGPAFAKGSPELSRQYNAAIGGLAEKTDCLFVDLMASYRDADWTVHRDGVHANDVGHRLVANKVLEVLIANCSALAVETKAMETSIMPWRDEGGLHPDF